MFTAKVKPYGNAERTLKRKKRIEAIRNKTDKLLTRHLPELFVEQPNISIHLYAVKMRKLQSDLNKHFKNLYEYKHARNRVSKTINDGNKQGKWLLDVPPYLIRVKRETPLRTLKWFRNVKLLNFWKVEFDKAVYTAGGVSNFEDDELLGAILMSAAINGGLCIPNALASLGEQLLQKEKLFQQKNDWFWIDLQFNGSSQALNHIVKDKDVTLRRWYPDMVTLSLMHLYLTKKEVKGNYDSLENLTIAICWNLMHSLLTKYNKMASKRFKTMSLFCKAIIGVTEQQEGVRLSQVNVNYAIGLVPSASLTPQFQASLFEQFRIKNNNYKFTDLVKIPLSKSLVSQKKQKSVELMGFEPLIAKIRDAIGKYKDGSKKRSQGEYKLNTPTNALKKLTNILAMELPDNGRTVILWLFYLLDVKKRKVQTLSTYFSAIGIKWLSFTVDIDLNSLDESDFFELYESILDVEISDKSKSYCASRFQEFHQFSVRSLDFPPLSQPLPFSKKGESYVRTGFITESAFKSLLQCVTQITDLQELTKQGLKCLLIIAYRTGLRRGELIKLKYFDIENSNEKWMYIRNNKYGTNKSYSALRKIPLTVLLLEEEQEILIKYLAARGLDIDNKTNALLFSMPATNETPLDANKISSMVKYFLKMITGDLPLTFHHLRHSALSKLHVVLENDQKLITELTPYSTEQANQIRWGLVNRDVNNNQRDVYWALAGVAGHTTPETTFAHYLHFTDKIIANKISKSKPFYSSVELTKISGLSSNFFTRLCNENGLDKASVDINYIKLNLIKGLKPFTEAIKPRKKNKVSASTLNGGDIIIKPFVIEPTFDICMSIMRDAEQGMTLSELVIKYQLNETIINKWVENAKALSGLLTSKNKSRLFSSLKSVPKGQIPLAPSRPQSNKELIDADKAIESLRLLHEKKPREIEACVKYFITHVTSSSSGISFSKTGELKTFLKLVLNIFDKNRWRLQLISREHLGDKKCQDKWQKVSKRIKIIVLKKTTVDKTLYPYGKVQLYLSHPDEKRLIEESIKLIKDSKKHTRQSQKYSSNTLTYIFHGLAIYLFKEDECKTFVENNNN